MAPAWLPYVLVTVLVAFVAMMIYAWRHKEEIFEAAGMELPPQLKSKKPKKKDKAPRPNAKNKFAHKPFSSPKLPQAAKPQDQPIPKKSKTAPKQPIEPKKISDVTIDSRGAPFKCMSFLSNGSVMIAVGKDHTCYLYAIASMDFNMYPFDQHFELDPSDILQVATYSKDGLKVVYAQEQSKSIYESSLTIDDEAKASVTRTPFVIPHAFKAKCNSLIVEPEGRYICVISDASALHVYNHDGTDLFEYNFEQKRCVDAAVSPDYSRIFVATGSGIEVFNIQMQTSVEVTHVALVPTTCPVISIHYSKFLKEVVCATSEGVVTLYTQKIEDNRVSQRWEVDGVRMIRASPKNNMLAIISGKSKMRIIKMDNGSVFSEIDETHSGNADHLEWSSNGNWLYVGSKNAPNIESFRVPEK